MADASNLQTSFLGGEWSPAAQGRVDLPAYNTALNLCRNSAPTEAGAWVRRSGDRYAQCTRFGKTGRVIDFNWSQAQPWTVEFTDGFVRLFVGAGGLLMDPSPQGLVNISMASPAVFTVGSIPTWSVGDFVMVSSSDKTKGSNLAPLRQRQFQIATKTNNQLTLTDPYTNTAVNGSGITFDPSDTTMQMTKIFELVSPYVNGQWKDIKAVQTSNPNTIILFHPTLPPYVLAPAAGVVPGNVSQTGFTGSYGTFTLTKAVFTDGPYLDPVPGSVATPGGLSGVIVFGNFFAAWSAATTYASGTFVTVAGTDYVSIQDSNTNNPPATSPTFWTASGANAAVNGGLGFQTADIGRPIRILSQPPAWSSATGYVAGNNVTYNGAYYQAIASSTNAQPDVSLSSWLPSPAVATWTWGRIVSIVTASSVNLQIVGPPLLYTGAGSILTWRLGAFTATVQPVNNLPVWPRCGAYHEGRLWMGGALPNRVDSSNSNALFNMAPTLADGTVTDASAITAVFNSNEIDTILWMEPDHVGLLCGTQGSEWAIQASQVGDILTPTSIQAHRQSKYGSSIIPGALPKRTNNALVFVHRMVQKVIEFASDAFTTRFLGRNLNEFSKHLTNSSIQEITHTQELIPTIWARLGNGNFIGCTYRRDSTFTSEPPTFFGWHKHDFGSGRTVESLTAGPSVDGLVDTVCFVTNQTSSTDPQTGIRHVTYLSNFFQETDDIYHAAFIDDGLAPVSCALAGSAPLYSSITFYGLWHLNGESVAIFSAGQDLGQFTITNGQVTIPFPSNNGLYTFNALQLLANAVTSTYNYGSLAVEIDIPFYSTTGVTTPQTITSYTGPGTSNTTNLAYDVVSQVFYFPNGTNVSKFSVGNQTATSATNAALGIGGSTNPMTCGPDHNWYFYDGGNVRKVGPALTLLGSLPNTVPGPSTPAAIQAGNGNAQGMCAASDGTTTWLVNTNTSVGITEINVSRADTMAFAGYIFNPSLNCSSACTIPTWSGPGWCTAHTLTSGAAGGDTSVNLYYTTIPAAASTYNIASWPTQNSFITTTLAGTITPSQIDAAWTHIAGVNILYDTSDGNLVVFAATSDAVTHVRYLMKVNAKTAAIMWKIADLPGMGSNPHCTPTNSRIQAGTLAYLGAAASGTNTLYVVNTQTGVVTTVNVVGVYSPNAEVFDDKTGTLLLNCTYTSGGGAPAPVGSTPGSFLNQWAQLVIGTDLTGIKNAGAVVFPTGIGFTFTSQAQRVRQLAPSASGARNGPALGKLKRDHKFSVLMVNTQGISFGTTFSDPTLTMIPARFLNTNQTAMSQLVLWNGVFRDTLSARYDFDNMLAWQVTRPFPAIVAAAGDFVHTQDI